MGLSINPKNYNIENGVCKDVLSGNQEKEGDERFDAKKNIEAGIKYLKWMQEKFTLTNMDDVIKSYNIGPTGLKNDPSSAQATNYLNSILTYKNALVATNDLNHNDAAPGTIGKIWDGSDISKIETDTEIFLKNNPYIIPKFGILKIHGKITPQRVVLHHTGGSTYMSAENAMIDRNLGVHFVLDKDGKLYMYGNLNDKFYHAGPANADSIGVEIVNTGFGESYTEEQYNTLSKLLQSLNSEIKEKKDPFVIGHFEVNDLYTQKGTAGKWDPSPNFDWSKIGYSRQKDQTLASLCTKVVNDKKLGYSGTCYVSSNIG